MVSNRSMSLASLDVKGMMAARIRPSQDMTSVGWAVAARTLMRVGVVFGRDRHAMLRVMMAILP